MNGRKLTSAVAAIVVVVIVIITAVAAIVVVVVIVSAVAAIVCTTTLDSVRVLQLCLMPSDSTRPDIVHVIRPTIAVPSKCNPGVHALQPRCNLESKLTHTVKQGEGCKNSMAGDGLQTATQIHQSCHGKRELVTAEVEKRTVIVVIVISLQQGARRGGGSPEHLSAAGADLHLLVAAVKNSRCHGHAAVACTRVQAHGRTAAQRAKGAAMEYLDIP